jgi:tetratricopeptide (TPR) repeat protein
MEIPSLLKEATASHMRGDLAAAAAGYVRVLAGQPDNVDALFLSGTLHAQLGQWERSADALRRLVTLQPNHVEGWLNLSHVLEQLTRLEEAAECYRTVLALREDDAQSWFHLGLVHFKLKRFEEAERAYRRHVELLPDSVEGHFNLGATLQDLNRFRDAEQQYERVLALDPRQVEAYRSLGAIALQERRYADAAGHFHSGLALAPDDVEMLSNLGVMLQKLNRLAEAEAAFRKAVSLQPTHINAHFNLALILLLQGKFAEGWREYEWRLRIKNRLPAVFDQAEWDGSPLDGKTLLLRAEQGFGDTFQFIRYASLAKAAGAKAAGTKVVLDCQPGLKRVLLRTPGIDMIAERPVSGRPLVEFDTHLPLLSSPRIFHTTRDSVPAEFPYIRPESWLVERWAARMVGDRGLRVGIVWAGRPTHEDDKNRSCALGHFLQFAAVPNVTLYSLQKGDAVRELQSPEARGRVEDLDPEIDDFADTAAAIANLDLVICVDTSVAHLAGAMNKPVWVVLPFAPDFRWMAKGENSPWYPSMRLFRQHEAGNWDYVFAQLKSALAGLASGMAPKQEGAAAYDDSTISLLRQARLAISEARWDVAAQAVAAVVSTHPAMPEANWLLGAAESAQGLFAEALTHLVVAYEAWPQSPMVLKQLGIALQSLGEGEQAEQCYLAALQFGNDDPEVLYNFGVLRHTSGDLQQAQGYYQAALALKPNWAECLNNLGLALLGLGRREEAIPRFSEAVKLAPGFVEALVNLGNALYLGGQIADAEACFRQVLTVQPAHPGAHNALGVVLKAQGNPAGAALEFEAALRVAPALLEARNNLGNTLRALGRIEDAVGHYRMALEQNPDNAGTWSNLGSALQQHGDVDGALGAFERALAIAPDFPEAHWNRALAWLLQGDYTRGWPEYEWGLAAGARPLTPRSMPSWSGEPLPGKTLLVSAEQGFGDTIQFARFLQGAKAQVGRLVLECHPALMPLLADCAGVDQVIANSCSDEELPGVDVRVALMSLPGMFGVTLASLPGPYPYVTPGAERVERLKPVIPPGGLKVGLVWAGAASHQDDCNRSLDVRHLAPLTTVDGATFFSLQMGRDPTDCAKAGFPITDLTPWIRDFADTTAALACLDLLICVDTAVAHLAGAMGKPVWVLLPFAPDWRWGAMGDTTPWYPSARLFRQANPGDWSEPLARVVAALRRWPLGPAEGLTEVQV